MKRNNKVLYEQIMRAISENVKRILNENMQGNISLYQAFIDKLSETPVPDYLDSCYGSESSDTWCYYANEAKFTWIDQVAENLGYYDGIELGKAICKEQGWNYDQDAETWDDLIDSCDELRDIDMNHIQDLIDEMYPYFEYD